MISFKKLLGKDEKFYDLLEASAEEARVSAELLAKILKDENSVRASNFHDIINARRKDKRITQKITEELLKGKTVAEQQRILESERRYQLALACFNKADFDKAKIEAQLAVSAWPGPQVS